MVEKSTVPFMSGGASDDLSVGPLAYVCAIHTSVRFWSPISGEGLGGAARSLCR